MSDIDDDGFSLSPDIEPAFNRKTLNIIIERSGLVDRRADESRIRSHQLGNLITLMLEELPVFPENPITLEQKVGLISNWKVTLSAADYRQANIPSDIWAFIETHMPKTMALLKEMSDPTLIIKAEDSARRSIVQFANGKIDTLDPVVTHFVTPKDIDLLKNLRERNLHLRKQSEGEGQNPAS